MNITFRRFAALIPMLAAGAVAMAEDFGVPAQFGDVDTLAEAEAFGLKIALIGMLACFLGLAGIYFALLALGKYSSRQHPKAAHGADEGGAPVAVPELTAEVCHAIALALYLDLRTFEDDTPGGITIRKVTRPYSAWWNSGKTQMIIDKWTFPSRRG